MVSHDSVLADHRNDVGSYRHCDEIEHALKVVRSQTVGYGKCLHELIAHATSRQVRARISRALKLWIKDSHGGRKRLVGHMMVTDDKIDTHAPGIFDFISRLDSAIKNDDEFDPLTGCHVNGGF